MEQPSSTLKTFKSKNDILLDGISCNSDFDTLVVKIG